MAAGPVFRFRAIARQALDLRESALGAEHALTLRNKSFLANLLDERGNPAAAEPLYRGALEAQERTLEKSISTRDHRQQSRSALAGEERFRGAETLFRNTSRSNSGLLQRAPQDFDELDILRQFSGPGDQTGAEALLRLIVEAEERGLGKEHPTTLVTVGKLADLVREKGDAAARRAGPAH